MSARNVNDWNLDFIEQGEIYLPRSERFYTYENPLPKVRPADHRKSSQERAASGCL